MINAKSTYNDIIACLLEAYLPYDPSCPSVGRSVFNYLLKGRKIHFHAHNGAQSTCSFLKHPPYLEHLDGLLQSPKLPGAHGEPTTDVNHDVGVPTMLRLHELILMLQLLRATIICLCYLERVLELNFGLLDV